MYLYQELAKKVVKWRETGYPQNDYPIISEILEWAANPNGSGFRLRQPQVRALETYWYLRLVLNTPHILDLYKKLFDKTKDLLDALGVPGDAFEEVDYDLEVLWEKIFSDEKFVNRYKIDTLQESLTLKYPSYILALAMGSGKTKLIGAIIATEFGMSIEYPEGPFVQNALVFAPGKTIIESLRDIADTEYDRILPSRLYKPFASSIKLTFTRDGEKYIPVIPGSFFNVIVTNTEKIRITSKKIQRGILGSMLLGMDIKEAKEEIANARLMHIASLPHLAIFSDEAHHTYGNSMKTGLKKVRMTVDYLAENTNVICVVNTTGTPYFKRQPLRDVVIWYGLSEGIRDGILKEVAGNIHSYSFEGNVEAYLTHVIEDFFKDYGTVSLPDGTLAKLAIFFPQTDDVVELRPTIEIKLAEMGLSSSLILEHHTVNDNKKEFDRFKTKSSPHRIALLVNRGVEGWDVPSLFACALARKLRTSNNFVLQASSRCLRQIPGNKIPARIYLSVENQSILDKQLQETYGETITDLNRAYTKNRPATIRIRKLNIPPLLIKQIVRTVIPKKREKKAIKLSRPKIKSREKIIKTTFTLAEQATSSKILNQLGDAVEINIQPNTVDLYSAAVELSVAYRIDFWELLTELREINNGTSEMPIAYFDSIASQIETQTKNYEVVEEEQEKALALIKIDGFNKEMELDGTELYTTEITYPVDKEKLLVNWDDWKEKAGHFGFHYNPYNFDSNPERSYFELLLNYLKLHREQVEDIYFTGALTDPKKTDFYVEYKGDEGKMHRYTPDFVIRRKDGKCLIVEIKNAQFRAATEEDLRRAENGKTAITVEGRKAIAVKRWEILNPEQLKYEIIFTQADSIAYDQIQTARKFVRGV